MSHFIIPDWPALDRVKAYTSLRFNGHSKLPFADFNLCFKVGDDPDAVTANRQQLMQELELKRAPAWLNQVHGTTAINADTISNETPDADASYTSTPGVVCTILTADCLPIFLCNEQGNQVAAIHAGWRGLLNGVIANTVGSLTPPYDYWMAWLGPAIGPASFEVGNEVREQFIQADPQYSDAFRETKANTWLADLYAIAKRQLAKLDIKRVYGGGLDTYTDATNFYSYRRDQGKTGRMVSLIWFS